MQTDPQLTQLEDALMRQAQALAREQRELAAAACARIQDETAQKLALETARETLAAQADAERLVRRRVQAAEARLAAELDRQRWALTEATLAQVSLAFQELVADDARYLAVLEAWLAAAASTLPAGDLRVEARAADLPRLAPAWPALAARAAPGRQAVLASHAGPSAGGLRVYLADGRARLDQSFEARRARLAGELERLVMARLFAREA